VPLEAGYWIAVIAGLLAARKSLLALFRVVYWFASGWRIICASEIRSYTNRVVVWERTRLVATAAHSNNGSSSNSCCCCCDKVCILGKFTAAFKAQYYDICWKGYAYHQRESID